MLYSLYLHYTWPGRLRFHLSRDVTSYTWNKFWPMHSTLKFLIPAYTNFGIGPQHVRLYLQDTWLSLVCRMFGYQTFTTYGKRHRFDNNWTQGVHLRNKYLNYWVTTCSHGRDPWRYWYHNMFCYFEYGIQFIVYTFILLTVMMSVY